MWQLQTVRGRLYTRASRLLPCRLPSKNLPKSWTELARHTGHPSGDGWDWEPTGIEPTRVAKHVSDAPRARSVHLIILILCSVSWRQLPVVFAPLLAWRVVASVNADAALENKQIAVGLAQTLRDGMAFAWHGMGQWEIARETPDAMRHDVDDRQGLAPCPPCPPSALSARSALRSASTVSTDAEAWLTATCGAGVQ